MTERFLIDNKISLDNDKIDTYELTTLVDMENKTFYFIIDSLANIEAFKDRLNDLNNELKQTKKEIKEIQEGYEAYKTLYEEMSYYFEEDATLKDIDEKDFRKLQRLSKGLID